MAQLLRALRLLGDEGRLRILRLLQSEELSVAELQEILGMGQSRISMQLAQLKQAGLIDVRRAGQKSLYRMADLQTAARCLSELLREAGKEIAPAAQDDRGLRLDSRQAEGQASGLFRRTGRAIRPQLRSGAKLERPGGNVPQAAAAAGGRRSGRGRGHAFAVADPASRARNRGRSFGEDAGVCASTSRSGMA